MALSYEQLLAMLARGDSHIQDPPPLLPQVLPQNIPEGTLLGKIRRLAETNGYLLYHTYSSKKSEPGFPDLALTDGSSLLLYELKSNTGKLTHEQETWLSLLARVTTLESGIWRPRDYPAIVDRLTRRAP